VSAPSRPPMVMSPSSEDAAFITHALRDLARVYRRNGAVVPSGVAQLVAHLISGVSEGQRGSSNDGPDQTEERIEHGPPLLIKYETAAQLLEVSVSTVKRLIKAGELHPVTIGGAARLRRSELEQFVANANANANANSDGGR
jgi:excisionase family DNA binding protein